MKIASAQVNSNEYISRYNTTSHKLLKLEEKYSYLSEAEKRNYYDSKYKKLDELIDVSKIRLGNFTKVQTSSDIDDVTHILKTIDSLLIEQFFIICVRVHRFSDALTPKKMDKFECVKSYHEYGASFYNNYPDSKYYGIDCDLGSLLYLSIGEVLNLPLRFVEVPEHNFIRWEFTDKTYVNWDTNKGRVISDDDYRNGIGCLSFTRKEEKLNHYLENMNQNEIKGYYLSLIAMLLSDQNRYLESQKLYLQAIEFRPYDALSCNNLSWMYLTEPFFNSDTYYQKAYELSLKVDSLLPKNITYKDTYSCACAGIGDFEKAIQIEKEAKDKKYRIDGYKHKKTCLDLGEK